MSMAISSDSETWLRRLVRLALNIFTGRQWGRRAVIAVPFLWLAVFFFIPFLVVFKISFAETQIAVPPYSSLLDWNLEEGYLNLKLYLGNYQFLTEDAIYFQAYLSSVKIALISTLLTLMVAFPMAYQIARSGPERRPLLLALVILPFWTSFLLRVYAWIALLKQNGLLNELLLHFGLIDKPLMILHTDLAVYIGIVYTYLPFMVLPLYSALEKMDMTLVEASQDLGCHPVQSFLLVTLPLALPGIVAGCLLVFIPVVGEYVIPALLGSSDVLMIGRVLWDEFSQNRDWPMSSAVAIIMLLVLVIPIMLVRNRQGSEDV